MSLRKKGKEIRRLIAAFEDEASKFHDIKFSVFLISSEGFTNNRKFDSSCHSIRLWQYYGKLTKNTNDIDKFLGDLESSDLQWGVRGAELSSFALIEGEKCKLFVKMAKRAGCLFDKKESEIINSTIIGEIQKAESIVDDSVSVFTSNSNELAIWLNYLLYYVSMSRPGREKAAIIEPDPFSLSLLALEQILDDPKIEKMNKPFSKLESIKFKLALSFPGEKRDYVSNVVELLRPKFEKDSIFYDNDYQAQLARPNLDTMLQNIYRDNAELIVVFLCAEYSQKEWCGLEWRAIREIIKAKEMNKIMFIRFDNADVEGFFSIDGYIDANKYSEIDVSKFILERLSLLAD